MAECQFCQQTDHWSNKCPNRRQNKRTHQLLSLADFPPLRREADLKEATVAALREGPTTSATTVTLVKHLPETKGRNGKEVLKAPAKLKPMTKPKIKPARVQEAVEAVAKTEKRCQ